MKNSSEKLKEQDAPEKNSDKAFVQVGSDGKPEFPEGDPQTQKTANEPPKEGTLADR